MGGACADDKPPPPEPLSSVSSLEVHFDLLDLTELTDMSDQELAEVFADSDDENTAGDSPAGGAGAGVRGAVWAGPGVRTTGPCKPLLLKIIFSRLCLNETCRQRSIFFSISTFCVPSFQGSSSYGHH